MTLSFTRRIVTAGVLCCSFAACVIVARSATVNGLAGAKTAFRSPAPKLVDASVAERDPVWRLGRMLFQDPRLSRSGRLACATCHDAGHGWSNAEPVAIGDGGRHLPFKAPTLIEAGSLQRYGWIGRFATIAAVTTFALTSPNNMALPLAEASDRLRRDPASVAGFEAAFGGSATDQTIVRALDVYVASLRSDAPFDRWVDGDESAVGDDAKRGFLLFTGKGRCAQCHSGRSFTDGSFHDIGTSQNDPGRGKIFKTSVKLQHAFKTPSLRCVADRGPYMHDGSLATLEDVVDLYDRGGIDRPSRAEAIAPLHLSPGEKADLIAFLKSLSGRTRYDLAPQR